jgi:CTP:molybdopterin cytidylyltransferase MocA
MLPLVDKPTIRYLVDKPTIQYVVEEAVASGLEEIILVTGRNKRAIGTTSTPPSSLSTTCRTLGWPEPAVHPVKTSSSKLKDKGVLK